ncbi:MAG: ParB/RepB/Spo0J family partition protein [Candidatus Marinimicrobia bacterium]|jgi:ParB family chromosome partitioning protein|nr:ParB/RepB/Spo0J family partition protein [Candidatus Neomarinimicrobiota bacterium]|tara:strand:- start:4887 stop:5720 length:834 start_codon:yes stop_codon:yes gene_type:complete
MAKNKNLGQGLGALLTPTKSSLEDFSQSSILISKIKPNPNQPRKSFEDKSLKQLAQSIEEKGLITPITVKQDDNKYVIVAGERRYRAHKLLKKKRILAYVIDAESNKDIMYMALIENIQREDLNPIEEAKGYRYLQDNLKSSITEIAKTVGKSRPAVSNTLRLLKLPSQIQDSILKGEINAGQARAILQNKTTQGMIQFWKKLLKEKMSVRRTESLVTKNKKTSPQLQSIQSSLSRLIGEKVSIKQNNKTKKGFIKISFDKKTVNRVLEKLKSIKPD